MDNKRLNQIRSDLIKEVRRLVSDRVNINFPEWYEIKVSNYEEMNAQQQMILDYIDEQKTWQTEMIQRINEADYQQLKEISKLL